MESAESLLRDQIPAAAKVNESTKMALQDAVLSPRFYTTNFDEVDKTNIDALRLEWNVLMAEFAADINSDHFQRPANMDKNYSNVDPELYDEFVDFLISSITSEFSGCILYAEIKRKVKNEDMKLLYGYMARDESRHAGFINQWLKDFDIGIDLGFWQKRKSTPTLSQSSFTTRRIYPKRLVMLVTSPFSVSLRKNQSYVFIQYFSGLKDGVTMSFGMAKRLH